MKKTYFLIAIHSHQPVGNFGWVYEEAYDKAYLPFLEILKRHPGIKVALHYTGCLFDWLEEHRPGFLKDLKAMVARGQVELIGGGYYEPILPLITDEDKLGQIAMLASYIKKNFGHAPVGSWTAERVWEQTLAKPLSEANIKYTIVDDSHFKYAGIEPERALGYYVTEDAGKRLSIFPGSQKLRYLIPFKEPQATVDYLRELSREEPVAITYADDGEKFGLWPGTHKWVYDERWLEKFFCALEENEDFIKTTHFREYIENFPPTGRIYLPCASYKEMMEWSGGYFRNFLVKYPESNNMHKKMLYVSDKLRRASQEGVARGTKDEGRRTRDEEINKARRELYMGQCNCSYWHGVFGGLYLNHLRSAVYNHLIEAEKIVDGAARKKSWAVSETTDFDYDGEDELLVCATDLNLYFDPRDGGALFELDYKPRSANLTNVLARRHEPYHEKIREKIKTGTTNSQGPGSIHDLVLAKEEGLDRYLIYDRYRRSSFIDHFIRQDISAENFSANRYEELGDFAAGQYSATAKKSKDGAEAVLRRKGAVRLGAFENPYIVTKTVRIPSRGSRVEVLYQLRNEGTQYLPARFGCELNLSVKDERLASAGGAASVRNFQIDDLMCGVKLDFQFSDYTDIYYFPLETVSISEEGFERTYQGLCLLFHWPVNIAPQKGIQIEFSVDIR